MADTQNTAAKPKGASQADAASKKDTLGRAVTDAREQASLAARRTVEAIEANPLPAVVGGLAVGVIAGALLPRAQQERQLLAPVGRKLASTTKDAVAAAKDSGRAELGALGLTRDSASQHGSQVAQNVLRAVIAASTAALAASKAANPPAEGSKG
ncbi:hypothetical protein [Sphingomonas aracearum]|uniref:DUF3618 domain-containing protein n=1 Tax=Sphingomonas aracearum TaxID=2283317 RepID=A0A369VSX1_9SPHN|nr:hypothetical protein [Sphingomonas aracearum]RDE05113.1 hypothetical protein DVW87_07460 [Sphingomonas aracearum]